MNPTLDSGASFGQAVAMSAATSFVIPSSRSWICRPPAPIKSGPGYNQAPGSGACSALWERWVYRSFIFTLRPSPSTGLFHPLFEVCFLRFRSSRARFWRVGVSMHDGLVRPVRNSS
jgi:hypothetical protein